MGNPFEAMSQRRSLEEIEQQMQAYSRNLQQLKLRLDQAVTSSAWPAPSANPQPGDGKVLSFRKAERLTSAASPEPAAASGDTGATPFMEPTARSPSWSKEDAEVSEDLEETRRPVVAVRDDSGYLYSARRVYAPIGEHGLHGEQPPASRRAASEDIRSETGAVTAPHVRRLASSAQCRDSASPAPASGIIVRRASAAAPWGGASPAHAVAGRPVASRASGCVAPGAAYVCAPPQGQGATCSGSNPGCVTWVRAAPSPRTYGYQGRSTYAAPGHRRWGPRGAGPESLTAAAAAALVSPRTPRSRSPEPQARLLASSPPSPWQAQRSPRASWPREPSPPASPCPGVHRPCYPQSPEPVGRMHSSASSASWWPEPPLAGAYPQTPELHRATKPSPPRRLLAEPQAWHVASAAAPAASPRAAGGGLGPPAGVSPLKLYTPATDPDFLRRSLLTPNSGCNTPAAPSMSVSSLPWAGAEAAPGGGGPPAGPPQMLSNEFAIVAPTLDPPPAPVPLRIPRGPWSSGQQGWDPAAKAAAQDFLLAQGQVPVRGYASSLAEVPLRHGPPSPGPVGSWEALGHGYGPTSPGPASSFVAPPPPPQPRNDAPRWEPRSPCGGPAYQGSPSRHAAEAPPWVAPPWGRGATAAPPAPQRPWDGSVRDAPGDLLATHSNLAADAECSMTSQPWATRGAPGGRGGAQHEYPQSFNDADPVWLNPPFGKQHQLS